MTADPTGCDGSDPAALQAAQEKRWPAMLKEAINLALPGDEYASVRIDLFLKLRKEITECKP